MNERQKMIQEFMKNNPERCSTHGGYENYMRTKEILSSSSIPDYVQGNNWNFRTKEKK